MTVGRAFAMQFSGAVKRPAPELHYPFRRAEKLRTEGLWRVEKNSNRRGPLILCNWSFDTRL